MRTVVLCRSESEEYRQAFARHGLEALFVEPLRFVFVNAEQLSVRLRAEYECLVVSSPRAVEAVSRAWDAAAAGAWGARRVYAVGPATGDAVRRALGLAARGTGAGDAASLAQAIVGETPAGSRALFPCGDLSGEALPALMRAAGIQVDDVTVYETQESAGLQRDLLAVSALPAPPCCLVLFSPSGCEHVHRQLCALSPAPALGAVPRFALGRATAARAAALGAPVAAVAERPTAPHVAAMVHQYFAQHAVPGDEGTG